MEKSNSEKTSGSQIPFWIETSQKAPHTNPLNKNINVDVCIVGGGIAGLSTAYFLTKNGRKVAVLEDRELCSGETGRTTGYLTWVIDDGITNIIDYFGMEGAKMHVDSHRAAVDLVEQITHNENISCEFKRVPAYWVSRKPKSEQAGSPDYEIQRELEALKSLGMKDLTLADRPPYAIDDGKCIKILNQGQLHILNYCLGLAKKIINSGNDIYTHTKVLDWKNDSEVIIIETAQGFHVKSKFLVVATNIPLKSPQILKKVDPNRSYVVGGKLPKGRYDWFIFQDDSMTQKTPYKYGRFAGLNQESDMLFVGGEDHHVGYQVDYEQKYETLERWTQDRFPEIEFNYRWSGQIQEPADLMAYIGHYPESNNVFMITGDSGMGMTHCTLGGKLISDLIENIPNPWVFLYDPKRLNRHALPDVVKHLAEISFQYKDYFTSGVSDIEDIIPGEGGIYCVGLDDEGKFYPCTAVCPHMKGLVRWNSAEKSWDCPVHGSRFDRFGKNINGPAKVDLQKVPLEQLRKKKDKQKIQLFSSLSVFF